MREERLKSIAAWVLGLFAFIIWLLSAVSAGAQEAELRVRAVDTSQWPKVKMTLFASSANLRMDTLGRDDFAVTENGKAADVLKVETAAAKPMTVVLAIDTSGSMQGQPLADAKAAAKGFVQSMRPAHQLAVIGFNSAASVVAQPTMDKGALNAAIDGLSTGGDTALYDALNLALDVSAQTGQAEKNIIVLSDGADNRSSIGADQVLNRAKSDGVAIFGVGLSSPEFNTGTLDRITTSTGGRLVTTADSAALYGLYASLARELTQQYAVSYLSRADASRKSVAVKVVARVGATRLTADQSIVNPVFRPAPATSQPVTRGNILVRWMTMWAASPVWYALMLGLLFVAVASLVSAAISLAILARNPLAKQMGFYEKASSRKRPAGSERAGRASERGDERKILDDAIRMTRLIAQKRGLVDTIQLLLIQAEIPLNPAEFIFFHFLAVLAVGFLALLATRNVVVTVVLIVATVVVPLMFIYHVITKRKRAFHDQLPDVLTLVSGSLKAGYGLLQALRVASEEMSPPASSELKKVLAEAGLGRPLEEALDSMATRIGSENMSWTVMAIKMHLEVGGNLAELLETLAATIRDRDRITGQIKVLTAEGRISAIILFILPAALAVVIFVINRPYVSLLFTTTAGWAMVAIAAALMGVGALWLKKIVTIEV